MTSSSLFYPLVVLAGFLVLEAFYSGSEIASYAVNRIRIRYWAEERRPRMRLALFLLEHHPLVVITTLIGTNLSVYFSGKAAYAIASRLIEGRITAELVASIALTPLVFLVAEVLPKWGFRRRADRVFPASARLLRLSMLCFYPLVWLLSGITWLARRLVPGAAERGPLSATLERAFSRQALREYVLTGAEVGAISREQYEVMEYVRDNNRNSRLDFSLFEEDKNIIEGIFKTNIHRASKWKSTYNIGKYSAGCQVIQDPKDFDEFMNLCEKQIKFGHGNSFTYTLIEEKDI